MLERLKGKRLLILGGIPASIEICERAHEFGIEVYVTDYLVDSPAKKYADKSFMVSATDVDAVVELCINENIDGIFTGNVDLLLPYYAQICEKLGLPCYGTLDHFRIMTDKKRFKSICKQYGVPVIPDYTKEQINNNDIDYPVLVKPIDSSGSRGISICHNTEELIIGINKALDYSPNKEFIVEKYMTGEEVVLYYYFQDGNPVFIGMCDRYVNSEQAGVAQLPVAYIFPSRFTETHIKLTDSKIKEMFRNVKMQNGPIFLQAFMNNGIPCVYEPGYRLNGAREQYIMSAVNELNSADMLIYFALTGKMADFPIDEKADPFLKHKYACKLSPLIRPGTIKRIEGIEVFDNLNSVKKVVYNNSVGDTIIDKNIGTLRQVAYRAFIVEDSIIALKETIDLIQNTVKYYDSNDECMMLRMFNTEILVDNYN